MKELIGTRIYGVIFEMVDSVTYKIYIESKDCLLKVKIDHLTSFSAVLSSLIPEYTEIKNHFEDRYKKEFQKRDIELLIEDYQSTTSLFIGNIFIGLGKNKIHLQQYLLENSYAYLDKYSQNTDKLQEI